MMPNINGWNHDKVAQKITILCKNLGSPNKKVQQVDEFCENNIYFIG
jgi:hypothetical protein